MRATHPMYLAVQNGYGQLHIIA